MSMTIDRIGSIDHIQAGRKSGQSNRAGPSEKADSISLSSEALEKSELYQAIEMVSVAADVRADRVAALKQKINDPSYINDTIIRATADKIMNVFGF
jgi:negative regulator of flagellin synthesis FlgM